MERRKPKTFLGVDVSKIPAKATPAKAKSAGKIERQRPGTISPEDKAKAEERAQRAEHHRKRLFISHYLKQPNATKAALLAGYSEASADTTGSRLLKDAYVSAAIESAQARMMERAETSVEKVVQELAKIGFSNMGDYIRIDPYGNPTIDLSELDPHQWAAIAEVYTEVEMRGPPDDQYPVRKTKIKLHDKGSALEKIAKYLGMFNGRKQGGQGQFDDDAPAVTNYTLQIGNANIVIQDGKNTPQRAEPATLQLP